MTLVRTQFLFQIDKKRKQINDVNGSSITEKLKTTTEKINQII